MSNLNPPQMPLDSTSDLQCPPDYKSQTETINPEILPTTTPTEVHEIPTAIEISVTPENDPATTRDWFNLARKLRGQNRELLESIVQLEQALAESQQQLQEQGRQARRNDSVVIQQTTQLNNTQAQLQAAQGKFQQQQQEIEKLKEQLKTTQSQLVQVERECSLLRQRSQDKGNQLLNSQRQVEELQTRLQRQQRYALQYKAALDECLSKSSKRQVQSSAASPGSVKSLTPRITSIRAWSEQHQLEEESVLSSSPLESETPETPETPEPSLSLDQTLEELFSLTPEMPEAMRETQTQKKKTIDKEVINQNSVNFDLQGVANDNSHSQEIVSSSPQALAVQTPAPFSFDIGRNKSSAKAKIDLPSFLRRR